VRRLDQREKFPEAFRQEVAELERQAALVHPAAAVLERPAVPAPDSLEQWQVAARSAAGAAVVAPAAVGQTQ
jgi:hypothetical protein